jgi:quinol-cytochrome oxidoreductase complex cytochrome b subunit
VLGFFSLVISYAKAAAPNQQPPVYENKSPKFKTSIMPRTEFVTLYAQVKATLPGTGSLYDLVKILECYRNIEDEVEYVA